MKRHPAMAEWTVKEIEDTGEWDAFVKESPQGSLFTTSAWKEILERGSGFKQRLYGAFREGRLEGGVFLTEKRQLGYPAALNSLLSPQLGFLLPTTSTTKISDQLSREHEILGEIIRFLEKKYSQIDLNNAPNLNDVRPFILHGWKPSPRYTYYLDLSDLGTLWSGFDGSVRRAIRKAERSELETGVMECDPHEVYSLLKKTLEKHGGKNPIRESLVREILSSEELEGKRTTIGARSPSGTLVSVVTAVWDWNRAYYLIAASHPKYLGTGVNSLLIWELANRLSEASVYELDFIGANIPTVARFKENFNPRLVTYYHVETWPSPVFKIIKKTGQRLLGRSK